MDTTNLLRALYKGDLEPANSKLHYSTKQKELTRALCDAEKSFKKILTKKQWEFFETVYQDAEFENTCLENENNFITGFRLGTQLLLAMLFE